MYPILFTFRQDITFLSMEIFLYFMMIWFLENVYSAQNIVTGFYFWMYTNIPNTTIQ
jgi:hypothetical protein